MTGVGNCVADHVAGPSSGQSSFDNKNRKKRAAKNLSLELEMPELEMDPFIEAFYSKFMRKRKFKVENS
jgi:hypothetical protein